MKRTYEFMLILKSDFPVDDTKKRDALIAKLTKGATVKNIVTWGKKQLAYPIKKQNDGIYLIITLEAESLKSGDVENEAKLGTDVLRFMLLQKEG